MLSLLYNFTSVYTNIPSYRRDELTLMYLTEFLDADIFRLVFSQRINILKLKVGALI